MSAPRCDYELLGGGPRCCRDAGHEGQHRYKCAGLYCPGLTYPAHVLSHPASCVELVANIAQELERRPPGADDWGRHAAAKLGREALDSGDPLKLAAAVDTIAAGAIDRHRRRFTIGTRVRTLRGFSGVPINTIGVVDEHYAGGVMVAWDLEDRPLAGPSMDGARAYAEAVRGGYKPRPQFATGAPLRDGFAYNELAFLEVTREEDGDA